MGPSWPNGDQTGCSPMGASCHECLQDWSFFCEDSRLRLCLLSLSLAVCVCSRFFSHHRHGRFEVVCGFVNGLFLMCIGVAVFVEGVERLVSVPEVSRWGLVVLFLSSDLLLSCLITVEWVWPHQFLWSPAVIDCSWCLFWVWLSMPLGSSSFTMDMTTTLTQKVCVLLSFPA